MTCYCTVWLYNYYKLVLYLFFSNLAKYKKKKSPFAQFSKKKFVRHSKMKSFCFSYCLQLHQTVFFSRELSSSKMKKNMYSYNKMFKATISGIFAAYIGCHQVKHLAQNLLFNAQSSNFFLMPLTFLKKTETRYIFLKEKWIMGHQSKTIKV